MTEQKNAEVTDYRRGYSYKDVGVLLGIPEEQGGKLVNEIMKDPPRFLTAVDIDRVWFKAKPWMVTLRRLKGPPMSKEDAGIMQDAILKAGGIRVFNRIQWRFVSKQEAEKAAQEQPAIDGCAWIAFKHGLGNLIDIDKETGSRSWHMPKDGMDPDVDLNGVWLGEFVARIENEPPAKS